MLATPSEVEGVLRRINRNWEVVRLRNYVTSPKSSGYRAHHLVVERDGRRIEVQLRTRGQQEWADAVEQFANRFGLPLKDEQGPDEVLDFFRIAAQGIYGDEYGATTEEANQVMARFTAAQETMQHWVAEHRR